MEKTFRLICTGLMVLAMGCNFTACSSDDDDDDENGGGGVNGNRLTSITVRWADDDDDDVETRKFDYDNAGRIVKITYYYNGESDEFTTYQYSDSKIIMTEDEGYGDIYINEYTLTNGKITNLKVTGKKNGSSYTESETTYTYNGDRLASIKNKYSTDEVIWNGDNIASVGSYKYTYTDIDASAGWNYYSGMDEVLYNEGYFGQKSQKIYKTKGSYEYSYEMSGGKITKLTCTSGESKTYSWN